MQLKNTYIHAYINTYIHIYIHTHTLYYIHTYTHTYKYINIHTYMYMHTHTYIHTHILIHIHTQTVYDYPVNCITLTTVSNIRAHMVGAKPTCQIYVLKRTVLCQVLAVFLLSSFLS